MCIRDSYGTRDPRRRAGGNRIHHNKFHIVGKYYGTYEGNIPIATAVFMSVGDVQNFIYGNEVVVDHQDIDTPAQACAFYISGRTGGEYWNNKVTTNVPAFWIANPYGSASDVVIRNNTIVKADDAPDDFQPFRLGYRRFVAKNILFEGLSLIHI